MVPETSLPSTRSNWTESVEKTLGQAERMLLHDAIVLPISHSAAVNLIDLDLVAGWYPNPLDIHPFKHLAYASGRPLPNVAFR